MLNGNAGLRSGEGCNCGNQYLLPSAPPAAPPLRSRRRLLRRRGCCKRGNHPPHPHQPHFRQENVGCICDSVNDHHQPSLTREHTHGYRPDGHRGPPRVGTGHWAPPPPPRLENDVADVASRCFLVSLLYIYFEHSALESSGCVEKSRLCPYPVLIHPQLILPSLPELVVLKSCPSRPRDIQHAPCTATPLLVRGN